MECGDSSPRAAQAAGIYGEKMDNCTCESCVRACKKMPGWFAPGQAELAAEFLNMELTELFDNCLIAIESTYEPDRTKILAPRKKTDIGPFVPASDYKWDTGECIFLNVDRCQIHSCKPMECIMVECAADNNDNPRPKITEAWGYHQSQIEKLLNYAKANKAA